VTTHSRLNTQVLPELTQMKTEGVYCSDRYNAPKHQVSRANAIQNPNKVIQRAQAPSRTTCNHAIGIAYSSSSRIMRLLIESTTLEKNFAAWPLGKLISSVR
jgi:hypothetical protein